MMTAAALLYSCRVEPGNVVVSASYFVSEIFGYKYMVMQPQQFCCWSWFHKIHVHDCICKCLQNCTEWFINSCETRQKPASEKCLNISPLFPYIVHALRLNASKSELYCTSALLLISLRDHHRLAFIVDRKAFGGWRGEVIRHRDLVEAEEWVWRSADAAEEPS